jgi:hypothetical protein
LEERQVIEEDKEWSMDLIANLSMVGGETRDRRR